MVHRALSHQRMRCESVSGRLICVALDPRPRPVRRPARRRVHLLTALALLAMAAGLWLAGPGSAPVPAPRLQVAEARVAAAEKAVADEPAPDTAAPVVRPASGAPVVAVSAVRPLVVVAGAPVAVALSVTGPRAPPHS